MSSINTVGQTPLRLFVGDHVSLSQDLKVGRSLFKKGEIALVVKSGAKQTLKLHDIHGEIVTISGDLIDYVLYSDEELDTKDEIELLHGMKVMLTKPIKIKDTIFPEGAIGIVIKGGAVKQKIMFEDSEGWFHELTGYFSKQVKPLNKKPDMLYS